MPYKHMHNALSFYRLFVAFTRESPTLTPSVVDVDFFLFITAYLYAKVCRHSAFHSVVGI